VSKVDDIGKSLRVLAISAGSPDRGRSPSFPLFAAPEARRSALPVYPSGQGSSMAAVVRRLPPVQMIFPAISKRWWEFAPRSSVGHGKAERQHRPNPKVVDNIGNLQTLRQRRRWRSPSLSGPTCGRPTRGRRGWWRARGRALSFRSGPAGLS